MNEEFEILFQGLHCANCAGKIEEKVNKLSEVENASLNFLNKEMKVKLKRNSKKEDVFGSIEKIVNDTEPGVKIYDKVEADAVEEEDRGLLVFGIRFALGIIAFGLGLLLKNDISILLYIAAYIIFGYDVIISAIKNILRGNLFDENFLMSIATIGAFCIHEYPEGVAVMLFYQIGEFFQDLAVDKSRKSIKKLMNINAEYANLITNDEIVKISPKVLSIDDTTLVRAGEKIPVDAVVIEGSSYVDMSALIGEAVPRFVVEGDEVLSGAINKTGVLKLRVTKLYNNSTVAKILELVENANSKKSETERFITKFAKIYTPIVVLAAVIIAFLPPVLNGSFNFSDWIYRALVFLVSSCPCALVVSIPLGFFSGIGVASKNGILIKGSNYLQVLSEIDSIVFDKTGTLTKGKFEITSITTNGVSENEILKYAYSLEKFSNHPISKAIIEKFEEKNEGCFSVSDFEEISGFGLKGVIDTKKLLVGNERLMEESNIKFEKNQKIGTAVYVAFDGEFLGSILVNDTIKEDSRVGISKLKEQGVNETIILTGDKKEVAESVGAELKISKVFAELLPQDKVQNFEKLCRKDNAKIGFVGDGINDAPVLARADIGFAMGGVGSDAAIEAADIVIMTDEISKISDAIRIAKNTLKLIKQNIFFVLGVKAIVLILAAFGFASMWLAVFADVGVALIAILNSLRKK